MIRKMLETDSVRKRCLLIARGIARGDKDDIHDITSETFLIMLEKEHEYADSIDTDDDFCRLFRQLAHNAYRRQRYNTRKLSAYNDDDTLTYPDLTVEIEDIINKLPVAQRDIVCLLREGKTPAEIASDMHISASWARRLRQDAVNAVRAMLTA